MLDTMVVDGFKTEKRDVWGVISDLCDYMNTRLTILPDSKIRIQKDPVWGNSTLPASTYSFDQDNARSVEFSWDKSGGLGQLEMEWRNADDTESGVVFYPANVLNQGVQTKIGPYVYPDEAAAQAGVQRRFTQSFRAYTAYVQPSVDSYSFYAGDIYDLDYPIGDSMENIQRVYIAEEVLTALTNLGIRNSITLAQLSRDDDR